MVTWSHGALGVMWLAVEVQLLVQYEALQSGREKVRVHDFGVVESLQGQSPPDLQSAQMCEGARAAWRTGFRGSLQFGKSRRHYVCIHAMLRLFVCAACRLEAYAQTKLIDFYGSHSVWDALRPRSMRRVLLLHVYTGGLVDLQSHNLCVCKLIYPFMCSHDIWFERYVVVNVATWNKDIRVMRSREVHPLVNLNVLSKYEDNLIISFWSFWWTNGEFVLMLALEESSAVTKVIGIHPLGTKNVH